MQVGDALEVEDDREVVETVEVMVVESCKL